MPTKRFSSRQRVTKANVGKIPGNKPGVYRIMSAQDEILYIGKAKGGRLGERIYEHKGYFQGGTQFQYRTTASKEEADQLETEEIKRHIPPRNKAKK